MGRVTASMYSPVPPHSTGVRPRATTSAMQAFAASR